MVEYGAQSRRFRQAAKGGRRRSREYDGERFGGRRRAVMVELKPQADGEAAWAAGWRGGEAGERTRGSAVAILLLLRSASD